MSSSDVVSPSGLGWGESRRSLSSSQVYSRAESDDWIRLVTVCCKLEIPILNPPPLSIKTRSGRGRNSGIARQVPTDFRGRNAVLKSCRINKDGPLQYDFRSIIQEILVFAHPRLRAHLNIAYLLGIMWEEDSLGLNLGIGPVLVLDYADIGTLTELVERKPSLSFLEKVHISLGVGEAIEALHDSNIIHGDLKSENVLIQTCEDGKIVPKLTDFDLSLREPTSATRLPGRTFPWNAPEYQDLLCTDCLKLTDVFS
jgi:serine/threonine protein kinase